MFIVLRRIERWLHQHIFKVGWLITQDFQTTTILYYTFFLPGVLLHEVIYWLSAGAVNVRAERSIQWPEEQKVGELKLNFVQLHPQASRYRKAIIGLFPLIAGLAVIWLISQNIFQITDVIQTMSSGNLTDVTAGIQQFTGATDFWLWMYVVFAVGNTMFPADTRYVKEWRLFGMVTGAVSVALLLVGFGSELFEAAFPTLQNLVSVLQLSCLLLIGVDVIMVIILGTVEYVLEHVTDRSATFRNGKMYTMSREEAIAERQRQKELAARRQRRREREREKQAETGSRTVYELQFPLPGKPGDVPITEPEIPVETEADTSDDSAPAESQSDMADRIRIPQQSSLLPDDQQPAASQQQTTQPGASDGTRSSSVADNIISFRPPEDTPLPADSTPADNTPDESTTSPPEDIPLPDTPAADQTAPASVEPDTDEAPEQTTSQENAPEEAVAPASDTDTDKTSDKPVTDSRFGISPFQRRKADATDTNEDADTTDDKDTEAESDSSEQQEEPVAKRFGSPFQRRDTDQTTSSDTADKDTESDKDEEKSAPPAKRFGISAQKQTPATTDEESETDNQRPEKPADRPRRFGISPFSTPRRTDSNKTNDDEPTDTDTAENPSERKKTTPVSSRNNPFRTRSISPFSRMNRPATDDDDTDASDIDEDESILRETRQSQADDPVRGLFTGLSSKRFGSTADDDEPDTDDTAADDTPDDSDEPPPLNLKGLRPLTPPRISDDDIEYEDVDDYYDPDDF